MKNSEIKKEEFKELFKQCFSISLETRLGESGEDLYVCIRDKSSGGIVTSDWIDLEVFKR